VTFSFDATRRIVWLDAIAEGTARAGDLCTRHADALVPPKGWTRVDRRPAAAVLADPHNAIAAAAADELLPHRESRRRRKPKPRWSDVPTLFEEAASDRIITLDPHDVAVEPVGAPEHAPTASDPDDEPAWEPRFDVDDLGGLLDAKTPLLSRAFRAAKSTDTGQPEPGHSGTDAPDQSRP
jgi:hypothetical protein